MCVYFFSVSLFQLLLLLKFYPVLVAKMTKRPNSIVYFFFLCVQFNIHLWGFHHNNGIKWIKKKQARAHAHWKTEKNWILDKIDSKSPYILPLFLFISNSTRSWQTICSSSCYISIWFRYAGKIFDAHRGENTPIILMIYIFASLYLSFTFSLPVSITLIHSLSFAW